MADAVLVIRFRDRKDMEKEATIVRAVSDHPELGVAAASQLRRVFTTGHQIFYGLSRHQVGLMHVIAARHNVLIPF